jgi:predicted nucleic acid-binding protein
MLFELFNRAKIQHIENIIEQFTPDIVILNGVTTLTNISVCKLKDKYTFSLHVFDSHLFSAISYSSNLVNLFYWVFRKVFLNSILAKVDRFIAVQS